MEAKALYLYAMMAMSSLYNNNEEHISNKKSTKKDKPIPKGCKKYTFKESFGTLEVIASNDKNAFKKYNKWCAKNNSIVSK